MKKILTLCAGILLVFGLAACDENTDLPGPGEEPEPEVTEPEPETGGEGGDTGDGGETQYVELELIKDEYTLTEGDDPVKLEYNVNPLESDVNVTSSNVNTATVEKDEYGQWWITPVLAGYGDATLTVTASYAGYESDTRTATVTVQEAEEVSTVTGIKFAQESYELTVGTPKEFVYGTDIIFEGTGTHSQDFELSVDATYASVITIGEDGHTVTASEAVENITLTVTATGSDVVGEVKATTTISAKSEVIEPKVESIVFTKESYEVVMGDTLDLSSAVTVTGNETLTDTDFTLSCGTNDYISITDKVVTGIKPTSVGVTITATATADSSKTATATVTVNDNTVYVASIAFDDVSYTVYSGNVDEQHPGSVEVSATVTGVESETPYEAGYTVSVVSGNVSVTQQDGKWIVTPTASVGKADETATIRATSTGLTSYEGQPATADVTINITYLATYVTGIDLSTQSITVKTGESFTIGGTTASESNVTVKVTPEDADNREWTATTTDNILTIGEKDGSGIYTVVAGSLSNSDVTETATVTITALGAEQESPVTKDISVSIVPSDCDVKYVTDITLSTYEWTLNEGESFTIGGSEGENNVTVTVDPSDADDPTYTVSASNDELIEVKETELNSGIYTVTALEGAGGSEADGQSYTITVKANDAHGVSKTLALTVARPASEPTRWEVTGGEDLNFKLDVPAIGAPETDSIDLDTALTIKIYDQFDEEMTDGVSKGFTITEYTEGAISVDNHTISAVAGSQDTSATITIASSDIEGETATLTVTLTAVTYEANTITFASESAYSSEVAWDGTVSGTVAIAPDYVTEKGYTVECTEGEDIFTYETAGNSGDTLTFTHNGTAAGTVTYTITSADSQATCTVTLTVNTELEEPTGVTLSGFNDSYEKGDTITNLEDYVSIDWENEENAHYIHDGYTLEFSSSADEILSVSKGTGDSWTAECVGAGTATLTVSVIPNNTEAETKTAEATINVVISATGIQISDGSNGTVELVEGNTATLSVEIVPTDHTDNVAIAWTTTTISDGGAVELESTEGTTNTITATSAGTAKVTATAGSLGSVEWTITIDPADTSYTFRFSLINNSDERITIPEGVNVYVVGSCFISSGTNWATDADKQILTQNVIGNDTYYDVVVDDYTSVAGVTDGELRLIALQNETLNGTNAWENDNVIWDQKSMNFSSATGGGVYSIDANLDFESFEKHFDHSNDTNFYLMIMNQANSAWTQTTITCQTPSWQDLDVFNGSASSSTSAGTTASNVNYSYNATVGTTQPGTHVIFYLHTSWENQLSIANDGTGLEVPEVATTGNVAIYLCAAHSDHIDKSNENWGTWTDFGSGNSGGWITTYSSVAALASAINYSI